MRDLVLENEEYEESSNSVNGCNNRTQYFRSEETARENVNLRTLLQNNIDKNNVFCSVELFPVKKHNDLYQRFFTEMDKYSPLFYALTWHTKSTSKNYLSLELVEMFPSNTLLHLAANGLTRTDVESILKKALVCGITNIFVLRGDSTTTDSDFPYAVDLVRFIREIFDDRFCICVAGYPEMHPQSLSKELDLLYLKAKVDAGAQFIITQIFFEADVFVSFVKDCRKIGIDIPIIPGIFPIPDYKCLEKMTTICSVKVPKRILDILQPIKDNDEAVSNYGVELATKIIKDILESGTTLGFHLFTLNRTSMSSKICDRVGIFQ